jgi:hypothetical protein
MSISSNQHHNFCFSLLSCASSDWQKAAGKFSHVKAKLVQVNEVGFEPASLSLLKKGENVIVSLLKVNLEGTLRPTLPDGSFKATNMPSVKLVAEEIQVEVCKDTGGGTAPAIAVVDDMFVPSSSPLKKKKKLQFGAGDFHSSEPEFAGNTGAQVEEVAVLVDADGEDADFF